MRFRSDSYTDATLIQFWCGFQLFYMRFWLDSPAILILFKFDCNTIRYNSDTILIQYLCNSISHDANKIFSRFGYHSNVVLKQFRCDSNSVQVRFWSYFFAIRMRLSSDSDAILRRFTPVLIWFRFYSSDTLKEFKYDFDRTLMRFRFQSNTMRFGSCSNYQSYSCAIQTWLWLYTYFSINEPWASLLNRFLIIVTWTKLRLELIVGTMILVYHKLTRYWWLLSLCQKIWRKRCKISLFKKYMNFQL